MSFLPFKISQSFINKIFLRGNISSNIAWLLLDKFVRLGLNFILTAWIARYLGKESFGVWSYAIAFTALFGVSSTLGLYSILLRDFVNKTYPLNELMGSAFFLKLVGGFLTVFLSYGVTWYIKYEDPLLQQLILITGIGYVVQSIDVVDYYFQSQIKARFTVYARIISFTFVSGFKIFFILFQYSLLYFVWISLIELFISALFLLVVYYQNVGSFFLWKIRIRVVKYLLKVCLPIMLAEVAIIIYMKIDQVMIGEMIGNIEGGRYAAAIKLSEIWYLFPGIICSSVFPSIIQSYKTNQILYEQKLQKLYDILAWSSILISVLIVFCADFLMNMFYGNEFRDASSILVIHIWASFFVFLGTASSQQLVIEDMMNISLYRTLLGVITNIILNFMLIPTLKSEGAALATLISYGVSAFISNLFFKKTRKIFISNLKTLNFFRLDLYN